MLGETNEHMIVCLKEYVCIFTWIAYEMPENDP